MGNKINPIAPRLNNNRSQESCWVSKYQYAKLVNKDFKIRSYIKNINSIINYDPKGLTTPLRASKYILGTTKKSRVQLVTRKSSVMSANRSNQSLTNMRIHRALKNIPSVNTNLLNVKFLHYLDTIKVLNALTTGLQNSPLSNHLTSSPTSTIPLMLKKNSPSGYQINYGNLSHAMTPSLNSDKQSVLESESIISNNQDNQNKKGRAFSFRKKYNKIIGANYHDKKLNTYKLRNLNRTTPNNCYINFMSKKIKFTLFTIAPVINTNFKKIPFNLR